MKNLIYGTCALALASVTLFDVSSLSANPASVGTEVLVLGTSIKGNKVHGEYRECFVKRLEDIARYVGHTRISIEIQEEDKEGCRNDPYSDFLDCYGNYYQEKAKDAEHAADTLVDVLLAALGYMIARGVSFVP